MSKTLACPKCQHPLDPSRLEADGQIICQGCGARLKAARPQAQATRKAKTVPCPKCQGPIDVSQSDSDGRVVCGACGARLKTDRAAVANSASPSKSRSTTPAPQSQDALEPLDGLDTFPSLDDGDLRLADPEAGPAHADPLATTPRPAKSALGESSTGGRDTAKASRRTKAKQEKREKLLLIAAITGCVVVLVGIGIGLYALVTKGGNKQAGPAVATRSDGKDGDNGKDANNGNDGNANAGGQRAADALWAAEWVGTEIPSQPVSFETPALDAGDDKPGKPAQVARLVKAEPFDEARHEPLANPIVARLQQKDAESAGTSSKPPVEPQTFDDPAGWKVTADAAPANSMFEIATDFAVLSRTELLPQKIIRIADRGGPFLLLPPQWEKAPTRKEIIELPEGVSFAPVEVVDLRTGEVAGHFDWKIPFYLQASLSPDGKRFLAPYHVPTAQYSRESQELMDAMKSLYVWQRDSDAPPVQLAIEGYASWFGFHDEDTVIVLMEVPARELQFWGAATGRKTFAVKLPPDTRYALGERAVHGIIMQRPVQRNDVAISPGGRLVAVVTGDTVSLIDVRGRRIVGATASFLPTDTGEQIKGLSFSPDGTKIVVVYSAKDGASLVEISATDGRRLVHQEFTGYETKMGWGPLFPGPQEGSWIQAGRYSQGQNVVALCYQFGRTEGTLLPVKEVLFVGQDGSAVVEGTHSTVDTGSSLFAMDAVQFERMLRAESGGAMGPVVMVERGSQQSITPQAPVEWRPLTGLAPTPDPQCTELPARPWNVSWGNNFIAALIEFIPDENLKFGSRVSDCVWLLDGSGRPVRPPVELRRWKYNPRREGPPRRPAVPRDGSRIVLSDPHHWHRLDVWSIDGEWLYGFHPFEDPLAVVEWVAFDADDRLLVAGGGAIARFELGEQSVTAQYQTRDAHYLAPFELSPDRTRVIASRGHSLDVLDAASGQVLNRLAINASSPLGKPDRLITDFAVSPDGARAAAVYASQSAGEVIMRHQVAGGGSNIVLGLWELESGDAWKLDAVRVSGIAQLAWINPGLLAIGDTSAKLLDLKTGQVFADYDIKVNNRSVRLNSLASAPDGRLWVSAGHDVAMVKPDPMWAESGQGLATSGRIPFWRISAVSDAVTEKEAPFFSGDRKILSLLGMPLKVTIDIGSPKLAEVRAKGVLRELQNQGFSIGPSEYELHVSAEIRESDTLIPQGDSRTRVPRIEYLWSLRDQQQRVLWSSSTYTDPDMSTSRYLRKEFNELAEQSGLQQKFTQKLLARSPYDFQGMPVREAVAKEILEIDTEWRVPQLPVSFMLVGDAYRQTPVEFRAE
jgi:WD40 repeat protein/DNA-directed RNA polymerase subunit M/transcription elongation factor TFIIS